MNSQSNFITITPEQWSGAQQDAADLVEAIDGLDEILSSADQAKPVNTSALRSMIKLLRYKAQDLADALS